MGYDELSQQPAPPERMQPADPEWLQAESPTGADRNKSSSATPSMLIAGALPLATATIALLSGFSVEVRGSGSWTLSNTLMALIATAIIGFGCGALLIAMFRGWSRAGSTGRFFLFVFITLTYGVAAFASWVVYIAIAITRDPPEC